MEDAPDGHQAIQTPDLVNEPELIKADLALNRNKIERADDKALRDQVMLQVLLRSVS